MASDKLKIIFDILLGKNDASKGLKNTQKETKKTEKAVDKLKGSFLNVKSAIGLVGVGIAGLGVKKLVDAAIVQERAVNSLNVAMAKTGEFSVEASKGMQDLASALQETSMHGDEFILDQLALAKAFGQTNEQAQGTVKAAVDMSAAMGISLDSAVRNLSKSLGGQLGELGELIPETKNLTKEQLKAGGAIDLVAKKLGGFAENQMKTAEGSFNRVEKLVGDLQEEFGNIIIKSPEVIKFFEDLADGLKELISFVPKATKGISDFVGSLVDMFDDTEEVNDELRRQGFIIGENIDIYNKSKKPQDDFTERLKKMSNESKKATGRVKELNRETEDLKLFDQDQAELQALYKKWEEEDKKRVEKLTSNIGAGISALGQGKAGFGQLVSGLASQIPVYGAIAGPLVELMGKSSEELRQNISDFADGAVEFMNNLADNMDVLIEALIEAAPRVIVAFTENFAIKMRDPRFWLNIAVVFVKSIVKALPEMAKGMLGIIPGVLKDIFGNVGKWILEGLKKIAFLVPNLLFKLFKFDGGGKGAVEKFLGFDFPFIKFSKGGKVPGQAVFGGDHPANDTVPALLSPGEVVLSRSQVKQFENKPVGRHFLGLGSFFGSLLWKESPAGQLFTALGGIMGADLDQVIDDGIAKLGKIPGLPEGLIEVYRSLRKIGGFDLKDFIDDPLGIAKSIVKNASYFWGDSMKKLMNPNGLGAGPDLGNIFDPSTFKIPGMNRGGVVTGFGNRDSVQAMLTPGERVLTQDQNRLFEEMLATLKFNKINNGGSGVMQVNLQIGERDLAKVLVDINRNNLRAA